MENFNKKRLHVALHARGGTDQNREPTYHWSLVVCPKKENPRSAHAGTRYHVTNSLITPLGEDPWRFEAMELKSPVDALLLVRITIAKITWQSQLGRTLSQVPVDKYAGFNCRSWVRDAIAALGKDGNLGTSFLDWEMIEKKALEYVVQKREAGRGKDVWKWDVGLPATYSLIDGKEIIS